MALNLSAITGALAQVYRPKTIRTFNAHSVLLRMLEKRRGSGKNCAWTWEGDGAIGENYTDGQDVSNLGNDSKNAAVLSWGMYRSSFSITDLALSVAASSHSPQDLVQLVAREFENASRKLASSINDEGYDGLGTGTLICGLDVALDDANTYAGVNRSTGGLEGFRASVFDEGSPTPISIEMVREDLSAVYDACGEQPGLAFLKTDLWNAMANKFQNVRRFNQDVISVGGRQITLDASVGAIEVDGCVFVKDKDATANTIYYINPSYVRFEYLPFGPMDQMMAQSKSIGLDDGFGAIPLGMMVKPLAAAGAAEKVTCEVQLQLVVEKPSACGRRVNVSAE